MIPRIATRLGACGLLPFIGLAIAIILDPHHALLWANVLSSYALAIICFLVGAWWGLALIRRSGPALIMSNAAVLMAFFGHVLLPASGFLLLCAVLFGVILLVERSHPLFRPQPAYYARLRLHLTLVASASLLLAAAWLQFARFA